MDKRAMVALEIVKEERTYVFYMPMGAPLGECYDAAFQVMNEILAMATTSAEQAKPQENEEKDTN